MNALLGSEVSLLRRENVRAICFVIFAFFGRVPLSVLYDNDRCLVAKVLSDGSRKRTTLLSGFLSHYFIEAS